jgi:polyhydroxyalkanoate synthesis regulator phasin
MLNINESEKQEVINYLVALGVEEEEAKEFVEEVINEFRTESFEWN